jgi:YfiH family protein
MIFIPEIFRTFPGVVAAQSMRTGGFSSIPYSSLNLGLTTNDLPINVRKNREVFFNSMGIEEKNLVSSGQTHGKEILVANHSGRFQGHDAIITDKKNLYVAVSIADCCPILLYDKTNEVVAAVHAGWRGTVEKILKDTVLVMNKQFNSKTENIFAFIGTCISERSFLVDNDVAEKFSSCFVSKSEFSGKYLVDLKSANHSQLTELGVLKENIEVSPFCTVLNNNQYFSYRKEGKESGRMLAVIGMNKNSIS